MENLKQKYNIIVAIGENGEIGDGEDLLWNLPADMKYFKETTSGADVIMGRKTFESIPKKFRPLKGRTNIVITRNKEYIAEDGVYISNTIEDAFEIAENCSETNKFIIGGGSIYKETMKYASKLYVTHVHQSFQNANTFFPKIDLSVWKEVFRENYNSDDKNQFDYSFVHYERK